MLYISCALATCARHYWSHTYDLQALTLLCFPLTFGLAALQSSHTVRCKGCGLTSVSVLARRFITVFVTVFATVIALTKDLADIEGDRQFNIQTFATQLGANRLALLGVATLTVAPNAEASPFFATASTLGVR